MFLDAKSSLVRRAWIIRAEFGGPAAEQYSGFHFYGPNQLTMNLIFLLNFFFLIIYLFFCSSNIQLEHSMCTPFSLLFAWNHGDSVSEHNVPFPLHLRFDFCPNLGF